MSSLLYDALTGGVTGIDSSTVLVQSLLDAQVLTSSQNETSHLESEDTFQCGKCKRQFTSLAIFMDHKKELCSTLDAGSDSCSTAVINSPNTITFSSSQNPVSSQLQTFQGISGTSVLLSEADLLSLTANLDQNFSAASILSQPASSIPTSKHLVPVSQPCLQQLPLADQGLGISLLSNTFVSGTLPLVLTDRGNSVNQNIILGINPAATISPKNPIVSAQLLPKPLNLEVLLTSEQNKNLADNESARKSVQEKKKGMQKDSDAAKRIEKLKCAYCNKCFGKNFDLRQHLRSHTGEKPFQCIVCGRGFAQKSNVKKHMQTHKVWPDGLSHTLPAEVIPEDIQPLGTSEKSIGNLDNIRTNIQTQLCSDQSSDTLVVAYCCPYCQQLFRNYPELKSHMKKHKSEKVYKCIVTTCGEMYHELEPFLAHIKTHENDIAYNCHQCSESFPNLNELGVHQYSHSLYLNENLRNLHQYYRCTKCLNKYSTQQALDHHMTTTDHNYQCPKCNKSFPCERYLRRHLHIHDPLNRFVCNVCNKGFKTEPYLRIHSLIHSTEKPFRCNVCHAAFNRQDMLKRHAVIHEPIKHYKCPFRSHVGCTKEFNRADKLKAHVVTHGGLRPFICIFCSKKFARKSHLRNHLQVHKQKGFSYTCPDCNVQFASCVLAQEHNCSGRPKDLSIFGNLKVRKRKGLDLSQKTTNIGSSEKLHKPECMNENFVAEFIKQEAKDDSDMVGIHIEIISADELNKAENLSILHESLNGLQLHPVLPQVAELVSQNANLQNLTDDKIDALCRDLGYPLNIINSISTTEEP